MGNAAADFLVKHVRTSLSNNDNDDDNDENNDTAMDKIRLVQIAPTDSRVCSDAYVPAHARTWWGGIPKVALSDGFPILIAFEASLQELNRRLVARKEPPIDMSRFRPNLVIGNTKPFEEDYWKTIRIGHDGPVLHLVKGCPRCKQSCTDQQTGRVHEEPLRTLRDFRLHGDEVYFAQNAIVDPSSSVSSGDGGPVLTVGQTVTVLEKGQPVWDRTSVAAE